MLYGVPPIVSNQRSHKVVILTRNTLSNLTGYNQSVTGCGSQRRHVVVTQRKLHISSVILILKLNLTSLRNVYIKMCVWCSTKTTFNVYVSQ